MSIETRSRAGRELHIVRWRDAAGRSRQRTFAARPQAETFAAGLARTRAGRSRARGQGPTLASYVVEVWWPRAAHELAPTTLGTWPAALERWVLPALGEHPLERLGPAQVRDARAGWRAAGCSANRANALLTVLSAVLSHAVRDGVIAANPCCGIRRLAHAARRPQALAPLQIERIRAAMPPSDALYVSLMGYAGLRPGEARALTWGSVGSVLTIDRSFSAGALGPTKVRARGTVEVLEPLAEDLAAGRSAGAGAGDPVVPGTEAGHLDLARWRTERWRPACQAAGVRAVPYDLRHSFASLLIHEGMPINRVAEAMRHASPTTTLAHYSHVFAGAQHAPGAGMVDAIRQARRRVAEEMSAEADKQ